MSQPTLHTRRLTLHALHPSLLLAFHSVWTDPAATQWSPRRASTPVDDPEASRKWMEGVLPAVSGAGVGVGRWGWLVVVSARTEGDGGVERDGTEGDEGGVGDGVGWKDKRGEDTAQAVLGAGWEDRVAGVVTFLPRLNGDGAVDGSEDGGVGDGAGGQLQRWELGFLFRGAFWGRGYATESCGVAIEALRREITADGKGLLVANVAAENAASVRVCTKLGFRETGRRMGGSSGDGGGNGGGKKVFLGGQWRVNEVIVLEREL